MNFYKNTTLVILLLFGSNFLIAGTYSGGAGTVGAPYQIATVADLIELSKTSSSGDWNKYFIQTANISFNADETQVDWDGDGTLEHPGDDAAGFSPIGNSTTNFQGTYNGQNYTISNLYINRNSTDFIGLFGYTNGATISNIGLRSVNISGGYDVGGLVGNNYDHSTITNSYSTGTVSGANYVGGLVGFNESSSTITNSYSTGSVSGNDYVGGLIGVNASTSSINNSYSTGSVSGTNNVGGFVGINNEGTISNSYSTGSVTRSGGSGSKFGCFCGYNYNSTIQNCYSVGKVYSSTGTVWNEGGNKDKGFVGFANGGTYTNNFFDSKASEQADDCENATTATAKTTAEMKMQTTFTTSPSNWDFSTIWNIQSGTYISYPYLAAITYDAPEASPAVNPIPGLQQKYSGGSGTSGDPYQIATTDDLIELSNTSTDWAAGKYFIQTANIAFNSDHTIQDWNGNGSAGPVEGFSPIGNSTTNFQGTYNGQSYTISNLFINRASDYIGLFGYTKGATIENLGLLNVNISGDYYVGGLVGYNYNSSSISNSYSTGSVSGIDDEVGGLVGYNYISTVSNSYSTGSVSGGNDVGGLVGYNFNGSISNSYSTGSVSGDYSVGGLVGNNYNSTISNSYSTDDVIGNLTVGGLVGINIASSSVSNSYSTGNVTRSSGSFTAFGGFCGYNNSTIEYCYSTGKVFEAVGTIWDEAPNGKDKGFLGSNDGGTYTNNFFDATLSEQISSLGGTAKTTAEMKMQTTFTTSPSNWDFSTIWNIQSGTYISYPYLAAITYDAPEASPAVNPIPGLERNCATDIYVDASYNSSTTGWGITHFADLSLALAGVCTGGTVNIANVSNTAYSGNVDFSGFTVILGNYDFELIGNINAGLIRTTNTGKLIMKDLVANTTKTFPITDGTYNYTMTLTTADNTLPDISLRIKNNIPSGSINSDFWDISGTDNLNATVTLRVDKAAIAPKTLGGSTQLRYFDTTKNRYVPVNGDNFSIEEFNTYYIITITGVNKF